MRLGALDLYSDRTGSLTVEQHADALVLADVCAQAVLVMQSNSSRGVLAAELETGGDFHLDGRRLVDVAHDVVDRRLRFDPTDRIGFANWTLHCTASASNECG